jgi:hypothetical protein
MGVISIKMASITYYLELHSQSLCDNNETSPSERKLNMFGDESSRRSDFEPDPNMETEPFLLNPVFTPTLRRSRVMFQWRYDSTGGIEYRRNGACFFCEEESDERDNISLVNSSGNSTDLQYIGACCSKHTDNEIRAKAASIAITALATRVAALAALLHETPDPSP